jgi:hypothetical protein
MPGTSDRHVEFFGPDFARGPFVPARLDVAALQIAAQLAQLRTPLLRSDAEIDAHADYIHALAQRLAPDQFSSVHASVGDEISDSITTSFRVLYSTYSLLEVWLADGPGAGVTGTAPTSVTWSNGVVVQEIVTRRHYRVLTTGAGVATVTVSYPSPRVWFWACSRGSRVFYSSQLYFA